MINDNRLTSEQMLNELSDLLGITKETEENDLDFATEPDEVDADQPDDSAGVISLDSPDTAPLMSGAELQYPWPLSLDASSTVYKTAADGTVLADAVIIFDDIPEVDGYEFRIVAV